MKKYATHSAPPDQIGRCLYLHMLERGVFEAGCIVDGVCYPDKRLSGGWVRRYCPYRRRYYYSNRVNHCEDGIGWPQFEMPFGLKEGQNGGVDVGPLDRSVATRRAIHERRDLTSSEKAILIELIGPMRDPCDVTFSMHVTLASATGTNRKTVERAIKKFIAAGFVEPIAQRDVQMNSGKPFRHVHGRTPFYRLLPGEWLIMRA